MKTKATPTQKPKIGRPLKGDRALTRAEISAAHLRKLRAAGIVRTVLEMPADVHAELKRRAAEGGTTIGLVIADVVRGDAGGCSG